MNRRQLLIRFLLEKKIDRFELSNLVVILAQSFVQNYNRKKIK